MFSMFPLREKSLNLSALSPASGPQPFVGRHGRSLKGFEAILRCVVSPLDWGALDNLS